MNNLVKWVLAILAAIVVIKFLPLWIFFVGAGAFLAYTFRERIKAWFNTFL